MRTTELFDNYLFENMTDADKLAFDERLKTDAEFALAFEKHKTLIEGLNQHEQRTHLKQILSTIHQQEFANDAKIISIKPQENFIQKHGKTVAVAASVAFIAVISTIAILGTGGYLLKQQSNAIEELGLEVQGLKYSQDGIIEGLTNATNDRIKHTYAPANIEGTGFAINKNGYFITSWHMVKDADSVFVTNNLVDRVSATMVINNPDLDFAIFKLNNIDFLKDKIFPFSFKTSTAEIGDEIFTLGFPRRDMVYGEGTLSSLSGFKNDTSNYQISIPVNPGNSGGPLMDENGNIIGVIRGKLSSLDATGFAVKADLIEQTINNLENDSLKKELTLVTKKSSLRGLKRSEQVKRVQPFVFNVMVYRK